MNGMAAGPGTDGFSLSRERAGDGVSVYQRFRRADWAKLRSSTPLTLSESDLIALRGVNDQVSLQEVVDIYLPLSRLLNLHFRSAQALSGVRDDFLGRPVGARPYVIGIAGSVAVGKSTFARVLQALLARWPDHPRVALLTTDGFLFPNRVLQERGLMKRKGFPESYDRKRMISFLAALKAGQPVLEAPVYSHQAYDILPDAVQRVEQPDILVFEGLNVLQTWGVERSAGAPQASVVVSDFFDFSIYIDAAEVDIERWYQHRFLSLQQTVFRQPDSYFRHYQHLSEDEALKVARDIWCEINLRNLRENIAPTRGRANLVACKQADHQIGEILLRMI
ncbi:MAG: type I pantothenate kinase [Lautropia sp.]|nr:type I pantothenate kinase [Lautropia sp.]